MNFFPFVSNVEVFRPLLEPFRLHRVLAHWCVALLFLKVGTTSKVVGGRESPHEFHRRLP